MSKEFENVEAPKFEPKRGVDAQKFKARKLKSINAMQNKAKAKFLAERVSRN